MIRLLKKMNGDTQFWQAWKMNKQIHILSGTLGEQGQEEELPLGFFQSSKRAMEKLAAEKVNQGYEYVDPGSLIKIAVQYRYEQEEQFEEAEERSLFVEDLLDDILHETGNGELYGSEIGDGAGITFCLVVDLGLALRSILTVLTEHQVIDGAEIAYLNDEETYIGIYPEGIVFELV
ncbi:MAG: hypothetical protein ABTA23_06105 [Solibacillus sp.]